jgi:hypothetical protein
MRHSLRVGSHLVVLFVGHLHEATFERRHNPLDKLELCVRRTVLDQDLQSTKISSGCSRDSTDKGLAFRVD